MTAVEPLLQPGLWSIYASTNVRGQAYDADGRLLRATELAQLFDTAPSGEDWLRVAASLNGCFAAVRVRDDVIHALVDRIRSLPLFFAETPEGLFIADSAEVARVAAGLTAQDRDSVDELGLAGYVTGAQTLVDGLRQIPAGQALFARRGEAAVLTRWYSFEHRNFVHDDDAALFDRLGAVHERVFRRLLDDLGSRPIVLPLSGGYDSRLIAVMLREFGARDVLCFYYGAPDNWEARVSRCLAAHLGFRWTSVDYTAGLWRACAATEQFRNYFRTAGNLVSVPHLQDWPAVHDLARRNELPEGAVFVPGHTGDFLTGNHVPKSFAARMRIGDEELVEAILGTHYALWDWPRARRAELRAILSRRIEVVIGSHGGGDVEEAAGAFERWEWQERQAKFIVNSVRVYESFGYGWRLPWWDAELMDFWSRVPVGGRFARRLFRAYMDARHPLPVPDANTDRSAPVASAIRLVDQAGLRPLAKRVQRAWQRARWRRAYEHDPMAWFALVDRDEFRRRYTGREIGHAFFALKYLELVAG